MDIYDYIDSKDISAYLRSIKYEFTSTQKAFIVSLSTKASIKQKHEEFWNIINNEKDEIVEERINTRANPSLFGLLKEYMQIEDKYIKKLFDEKSAVYRYRFLCKDDGAFSEDFATIFPTYKSCEDVLKNDIESFKNDLLFYELRRDSLVDIGKYIILKYTPNGDLLNVDTNYPTNKEFDILETFEGMWFDIPTPFKRGDILVAHTHYTYSQAYHNPVVVSHLTTWSLDDFIKNNAIEDESEIEYIERSYNSHKEGGDISDMAVCGYFVSESGNFYWECSESFLNYEYYDGPTNNGYRMLLLISDFLKKEIDLEGFSKISKYILDEEEVKESSRYIHMYDDYLKKFDIIK